MGHTRNLDSSQSRQQSRVWGRETSRMIRKALLAAAISAGLISCTQSNTMRVSQNEAIVQVSAAPICGGIGAAKVAQKQAAIETIKAGYDRYIILGAQAGNNVRSTQMPGTYNTFGTVNSYGNYSSLNATTTYTPGPIIYSGTHDQSIAIRMFKEGEPGSSHALAAKDTLGPDWQKQVKNGINTC